jgi:hypothetical protein
MNNLCGVVENPPFWGADPGTSWNITFSGRPAGIWPVYNPAVIPPGLTAGRKISFPDPPFIHSGGKAGKTVIQ